jgi:hypothetical protein
VGADSPEQHRIAVRLGVDHDLDADDATCAGHILHDHWLADQFAHPRSDDAGHRVEYATGREGHHDGDGPRRVGLRFGRNRPDRRSRSHQQRKTPPYHAIAPDLAKLRALETSVAVQNSASSLPRILHADF